VEAQHRVFARGRRGDGNRRPAGLDPLVLDDYAAHLMRALLAVDPDLRARDERHGECAQWRVRAGPESIAARGQLDRQPVGLDPD
jgi:hypothetical protein